MSPTPRYLAACLAAAAACVAVGYAPSCTADPIWPVAGAESARDTIADLEAQGYDVAINWVNGYSRAPLSQCRVSDIHNPDRSGERPHALTTVYVDVVCPNEDWDWGGIGVGVGIG